MTFADFQFELLSHEILLENQQHPTLTPETGTFALYTNKQGSNNFNTSDCSNFKKSKIFPKAQLQISTICTQEQFQPLT
jgi:hypothetical protein